MRLVVKCPTCGGYVHPIEAGVVFTEVADRTCRKCKARWRVVAKPLITRGSYTAYKLDWHCTRGANV